MRVLIDGHNLLYKVGYAALGMSRDRFDAGCRRLMIWLADNFGPQSREVEVIFDARGRIGAGSDRDSFRQIEIRYARHSTADLMIRDRLDELVALREKQVAVVSDDLAVREFAFMRGFEAWRCVDLIDRFQAGERPAIASKSPVEEKPSADSAALASELLEAFSRPRRQGDRP